MPNQRAAPTVRRRRLARALRTYRAKAGLSGEQLAERLGPKWTGPKISRIEHANGAITALEVNDWLKACGVSDPDTITALEDVARNAGKSGWWSNYGTTAVPQHLEDLIYAEGEAESIRSYHPNVIPGWLQTAAYAKEITAATAFGIPPENHPAIVDLRMRRQAILTQPGGPKWRFVLHEALLMQRFVSHPNLMVDQLRRLLDVGDLPNVGIQIMPLTAGPHPGAGGTFTVFHFPRPWLPIATTEDRQATRYFEGDEVARDYDEALDRILAAALPVDASRETIKKHMEGHAS
ncbi:helix-turn-helix domain-containing protein [Streptomyces sp. NRRL S-350]|uniref:helix-turn-helix domain-containing protein n=1 Tax=Streptomyces sp. NRRL S-350 TaxID=1463902 RepID=UPI0004C211D4|nr:helix-turn-helix transcriptional regulator [Streptomyces sp. NRRL S-350]